MHATDNKWFLTKFSSVFILKQTDKPLRHWVHVTICLHWRHTNKSQLQIVHQKYYTIRLWWRQLISLIRDDVSCSGKQTLAGDRGVWCWQCLHTLVWLSAHKIKRACKESVEQISKCLSDCCRRLLSCVLNRRIGVNRYSQCRLHWVVLGHDHIARPDSSWLNSTIWVEWSWVGSGAVLTALDYSGVAAT